MSTSTVFFTETKNMNLQEIIEQNEKRPYFCVQADQEYLAKEFEDNQFKCNISSLGQNGYEWTAVVGLLWALLWAKVWKYVVATNIAYQLLNIRRHDK